MDPRTDLKLKHGALALLKHLSQSQRNRNSLGEAGTIEVIVRSKVWENTADVADMVQLSAIGIAKHLVTSHGRCPLSLSPSLDGPKICNPNSGECSEIVFRA